MNIRSLSDAALSPQGSGARHVVVRTLAFLFLITLVTSLSACDQFKLDEAQPQTSVSLEDAIAEQTGFESLIVSMYDRLQGTGLYGQIYMLYPEALTDNAQQVPGSSTNRYSNVFENAVRVQMGGYGGLYDTINEANQVISNIDNLGGLPADRADDIRNRIEGEARFLRGLAYFDLVRIYSYMPGRNFGGFTLGVPLRLEPTVGVPERIPRTDTAQEIYDQVLTDFGEAEDLLTGNPEVFDAPARINAGGVAAYLSRVHLYLENYGEVEAAVGRALGKSSVSIVDGTDGGAFASAWSASSHPESLFELTMTPGQDATGGGSALQDLTFFFGNNFAYEVIPSDDVLSTFQPGDIRNELFAQDSNGNTYITKYSGTRGVLADRIPLMRVSELYLNRAEARANEPTLGSALNDLNVIRQNRGLSDTTGVSGPALVDAVLEERRREFLFEGKRFFDFKRNALDIPKPNTQSRGTISFDGPLAEARLFLAPLPNGEVQSNPLIEQNPGY